MLPPVKVPAVRLLSRGAGWGRNFPGWWPSGPSSRGTMWPSATCWNCSAGLEDDETGKTGDAGDRPAAAGGTDTVGDSRDTRSELADRTIEKRLCEDMVFRGGGIGALPGCAVGSLTGAFFERGGTYRSFDDEINVSSCKLCELSLMLGEFIPNAIGDESGEDGVVEETEVE